MVLLHPIQPHLYLEVPPYHPIGMIRQMVRQQIISTNIHPNPALAPAIANANARIHHLAPLNNTLLCHTYLLKPSMHKSVRGNGMRNGMIMIVLIANNLLQHVAPC